MNKQDFVSVVRRFISPTVLAGVTLVGTMGVAHVAMAEASLDIAAANAAPSHPHGVMDAPKAVAASRPAPITQTRSGSMRVGAALRDSRGASSAHGTVSGHVKSSPFQGASRAATSRMPSARH